MIYGYVRVSTDKQDLENQRFELRNFAEKKELEIEKWIEEKISSKEALNKRKFGAMMKKFQKGDVLIVSELSRIGRNLLQVMSILNFCMENEIMVYTIKENYELGNNINSKVLAFAFGLSAEIERNLIGQRTKEALARKKAQGGILGRPIGVKARKTKLTGKKGEIKALLDKNVSIAAIARIMGVHRLTVQRQICEWELYITKPSYNKKEPKDFNLKKHEVVEAFEKAGFNLTQMAENLDTNNETLRRYLHRQEYMELIADIQLKERQKIPNRDGFIYGANVV